ncbi:MAG TPA: BON domain-containing protein [Vicinamibacteria bacterium]|nr:BON domain-containing protein [Vicinamibacteria bacterium]
MIQRYSFAVLLAVGSAGLLACTGTAKATQGGSSDNSQYASPSPRSGDAVDRARQDAEKAGEKIKEGAEKTGEVVKETAQDVKREAKPAAKEVGETVDATKQHLDVKAALLADKSVDASHIDIDVNKDTKVLYLRGTVPTAAQKAAAERIARDKADGFAVRNELTVMAVPR